VIGRWHLRQRFCQAQKAGIVTRYGEPRFWQAVGAVFDEASERIMLRDYQSIGCGGCD
jgi:hypothetical protein